MQIGAELNTAVQKALAASGNGAANAGQHDDTQTQTKGRQQKASKKHKPVSDVNTEQPDDAVERSVTSQKQPGLLSGAKALKKPLLPPNTAKPILPSGDDLGDEFAIEVDAQEEDGIKRKQKPISSPVLDKADSGKSKAKKSKHKVVQF